MEERESAFILLEFLAPPVVEDILFPQLRKTEESIRALLTRNEFSVLRSDVESAEGLAWALFELDVWELPRIMGGSGPPCLTRAITSPGSYHRTPSPSPGPTWRGGARSLR